jgi:hypothetical protein
VFEDGKQGHRILFLCGCLLHIIEIITCALASRREHIILPGPLECLRLDESTFKLLWKFCLRFSLLLCLSLSLHLLLSLWFSLFLSLRFYFLLYFSLNWIYSSLYSSLNLFASLLPSWFFSAVLIQNPSSRFLVEIHGLILLS